MTKDDFAEIVEEGGLFFSIRHVPYRDVESIDPLRVAIISPEHDVPLAEFDIREELIDIFSDDPAYYKAGILKVAKSLRSLADELDAMAVDSTEG